jgi:hypothetical protein
MGYFPPQIVFISFKLLACLESRFKIFIKFHYCKNKERTSLGLMLAWADKASSLNFGWRVASIS